ncbi:MAG: rRNA pseudouridine synthase [Lachnospiraceae bacterium]|nr:rRNA pseudouridine synthase [Lachnospiraceae bacterium]
MNMRLDKLLCEMGFGSRSAVKSDIKKGCVTVNGLAVNRPETKINTEKDVVSYNGSEIKYSKYEYYMLYKPAGCVSATHDDREKTVMDYFLEIRREGFFPVGRLDKDTEGLLLITNDGGLAHSLLSPTKHVNKVYYAEIEGKVTVETVKMFEQGIDIGDDKPTLPAGLEIITSACNSKVRVTITEGRYHQIKRMFEAAGCRVTYLKRLSMGAVRLDETLNPGEYRRLNEDERSVLMQL